MPPSPLPLELIETIVDIVAECCPESLLDCVLVSHQWNPRSTYHVHRIFRTPTITAIGTLHAFTNVVTKYPRLAALAISLEVAPDPEFSSASTFIPFHHLSTRVLPNVRHLVLGETLRWSDYPLLYRKAIAGFFSSVIALDLSCHFNSVSDLFRTVRSFKNVKDVRLVYPYHVPPRWIVDQTRIPPRHGASIREMFQLCNLELSLAILKPILDVWGDLVVNLSVVCPEMSTVPVDVVKSKPLVFLRPLTSLQVVKITVPVESGDSTSHAGLEKLDDLLFAPIATPDVQCFFDLIACRQHNWVGHREEGVSMATLRRTIQNLTQTDKMMRHCEQCLFESIVKGDDWIKSANHLRCDARAIEDNVRQTCGDLIAQCVVVGNGRPSPVLFIEVAEDVDMDEARVRREIIRRTRHFHARRYLHERITSKNMVAVVPRGSLPHTATNGNVVRRMLEEDYKAGLDAMFDST